MNGGQSDKAVCEVSHRHLVFNRTKIVMRRLFGLTLTETSEVLFNNDAFFIDVFVECSSALYAASGIVSGVDILCAAISVATGEACVVERACIGCGE